MHQVYLPYIYAEVKEKYITSIPSYANQANNYNIRLLMSYNVIYRLHLKIFPGNLIFFLVDGDCSLEHLISLYRTGFNEILLAATISNLQNRHCCFLLTRQDKSGSESVTSLLQIALL